jgi:GNAT superfamily N-acetyltransferase
MLIREAVHTDYSALHELFLEHAGYEGADLRAVASPERIHDLLLDPERPVKCLVLEAAGGLAGYGTATLEYSTWRARKYLHMDCLYLRPWARRQGFGRRMVWELCGWARSRGLAHAEWQTPLRNEGAIAFYLALGAHKLIKARFSLAL